MGRTLAEEYGDSRSQVMHDEEWISSGTCAGFILLAKDHRVAARPLEAIAIYLNDARVIAFDAEISQPRRWVTCASPMSVRSSG